MHLLSSHNRSEFLACPQLIRFEYAQAGDRFEPTLLIKATTLLLKYVVLGAPMQLAFTMRGGRLICALRVCDDGTEGGIIWSVVERQEELDGIRGLADGKLATVFLFNELAVNVAWNTLPPSGTQDRLSAWAASAMLGHFQYGEAKHDIHVLLGRVDGFDPEPCCCDA